MFAYIGPGAGFAFLSSLLAIITSGLIAVLALALWPFRKIWRILTRPKRGQSFARRFIVVGFEGPDSGQLPNVPAFWEVLGQFGVWSTVLCAPTTLPLRRFYGAQLAVVSGSSHARPPAFVSQPSFYARYLAKRLDKAGAAQLAGRAVREEMFFAALARLRQGALVCVFDTSGPADDEALVGRIRQALRQDDLFIAVSNQSVSFTNRRIDRSEPAIADLAPTALRTFGIEPPPGMPGGSLFTFAPGEKGGATS